MMKITLDQAAMYMTMFYYQNLNRTWDYIFPDINKGFHGTRIGDYNLEKQKLTNGWKLKNDNGCPLFFTFDRFREEYIFLLFCDVPVYSTGRILKAISFEDKI